MTYIEFCKQLYLVLIEELGNIDYEDIEVFEESKLLKELFDKVQTN